MRGIGTQALVSSPPKMHKGHPLEGNTLACRLEIGVASTIEVAIDTF